MGDVALGGGTRFEAIKSMDSVNKIRKLRKIGIKELPPPYPNGWYSIFESSDLKRGESKSVCVLGEQLVIFRTLNSIVYVLDAYCSHLGANIGIGGKVFGDTIECPFHKWSFRGSDGVCVNVPYSNCAPQISKLRNWISREVNDSIFIWYSADPDQVPWEIPTLPGIETNEFVYHGRNEFHVNCHIQEIPENGADLAHFKAIHNISVLAGGVDPNSNMLKDVGKHIWETKWTPSITKHIALVTLKHSFKVTQQLKLFQMNITGEQVS